MTSDPPNWQLIDEATRALTGHGLTPFSRQQVYEEIWKRHPERQRASLDPTFQGMIRNAAGGPASAGGTPLRRVERGLYVRTPSPGPALEAPVHRPESVGAPGDDPLAVTPGDAEVTDLLVGGVASLREVLSRLSQERPVFHSEADFQQAFAWHLHLLAPTLNVRLETRPAPGMRLDLLASDRERSRHTAIEFKYLTKRWEGEVNGERFELKDQGAQDISGYDVVKDVCRVEQFTDHRSEWNGAVICLSNDPYYWRPSTHERPTNADAFRLTDGTVLRGVRAWGPLTGAGTKAGRDRDLHPRRAYGLSWSAYSLIPGARGEFRVLIVPIFDRLADSK